jgi:hypothetical protein
MNDEQAMSFARGWIKAWNGRNVEEVLSHFADVVVFTALLLESCCPGRG